MATPLVSVCIPTYNGDAYLDACLASVRRRHTRRLKLVVDDCSVDETLALTQRHANLDARIRVIRNPQQSGPRRQLESMHRTGPRGVGQVPVPGRSDGAPVRRKNVGWRIPSHGLLPTRLHLRSGNEATRALFTDYTEKYSLAAAFNGATDISPEQICEAALRFDLHNFAGEPTGCLLHKSVFDRVGYFDDRFIQLCDMEFWLRVGVNLGLSYVPETLVHFRVHGASTTSNNERDRRFHKDVIDRLNVRHAFGQRPEFEPLRRFAAMRGLDLARQFETDLMNERRGASTGTTRNGWPWPGYRRTWNCPWGARVKWHLKRGLRAARAALGARAEAPRLV